MQGQCLEKQVMFSGVNVLLKTLKCTPSPQNMVPQKPYSCLPSAISSWDTFHLPEKAGTTHATHKLWYRTGGLQAPHTLLDGAMLEWHLLTFAVAEQFLHALCVQWNVLQLLVWRPDVALPDHTMLRNGVPVKVAHLGAPMDTAGEGFTSCDGWRRRWRRSRKRRRRGWRKKRRSDGHGNDIHWKLWDG